MCEYSYALLLVNLYLRMLYTIMYTYIRTYNYTVYVRTYLLTRSALTAEVITECGPTTVTPVISTKTTQ